jgi:hypothetical protein
VVEKEGIVMLSGVRANIAQAHSVECLLFTETRDITVPISADLTRALDRKSQSIPGFRDAQRARMQLARELGRLTAAQRKAEMNARFREAVRRALSGAGASDPDVHALLQDPYFNSLSHFDDLGPTEQYSFMREHPEAPDLAEVIEDARYDLHDFTKWLDNPVRRFLDDIVTPLSALAMIHPYTRAGAMAYSGARAAIAMAPRMRAAAAIIGAGAVAGYDRIRAFFSENFSGGKDKGKADATSSRIQSTPSDADRYLGELQSKGVLSDKKISLDKREYYEFMKKCNHNGVRFRKGDYISRDTLHHEWEWFNGLKKHKGAIESVNGTLHKDPIPGRVLQVK